MCMGFEKVSGRENVYYKSKSIDIGKSYFKHQNRRKASFQNINSRKKNLKRNRKGTKSLGRLKKLNPVKPSQNVFVSFARVQPRTKNPRSVLPCFMQTGSDGSRFSLNMANEKAIRENYYGDVTGKKVAVGKRKRYKRKEDEESIDSISDLSLFDTAIPFSLESEMEKGNEE